MKKVLLANPRGFCAGVVRAIDIVSIALEKFGSPLYVRKEIVHNKSVVNDFKDKGVIFINELDEAPQNANVIFSAHGVSPEVRHQAEQLNQNIVDATCPLVTKVHHEVHRYKKLGYSIILIGHKDHEEVEGTFGEAPELIQIVSSETDIDNLHNINADKVIALTQTTLSVDEATFFISLLKEKFPNLETPPKKDICYATQNRQDAVREMVKAKIDLLLVIGSQNSSNSKRLAELAQSYDVESYLIDNVKELKEDWVKDKTCIGITAGASAPEYLVQELLSRLEDKDFKKEDFNFIEENVKFHLPKELQSHTKLETLPSV